MKSHYNVKKPISILIEEHDSTDDSDIGIDTAEAEVIDSEF